MKGFELPQPQAIELAGSGSAYLTFHFVANQRDLTLTVMDNDGKPVSGVTVGLFEPGEAPLPEAKKNTDSGSTDISETLAQIKEQKAADEKRADPYTKANAIYVGRTGEDGTALIQNVPVERLGGATARLRERIPDMDRAAPQGRGSVREKMQSMKQRNIPGKEWQAMEAEI